MRNYSMAPLTYDPKSRPGGMTFRYLTRDEIAAEYGDTKNPLDKAPGSV